MKQVIIILALLIVPSTSWAMTAGSPDISVPDEAMLPKDSAIKMALDKYEYHMAIKASVAMEFVNKRKLSSSPADSPSPSLKAQNYILKISDNFNNKIEPYITLGTSNLELKWDQYGSSVEVEADTGFLWGFGTKINMWESKEYGVKIGCDIQYRKIKAGFDRAKIGGSETAASATNEAVDISEWQFGVLGSKRYIVPIGTSDYYIVPYGGLTYTSSEVDVHFTRSTNNILYSTFDANDDNELGVVLGCDIMPFYLSYYLFSFELRLVNETAFTLGGTVKF